MAKYWTMKEHSLCRWVKLGLVLTKKTQNKSSTSIKCSKFGHNWEFQNLVERASKQTMLTNIEITSSRPYMRMKKP